MYLTLPLPIKKQTVATVHYIPADAKKPRYKVSSLIPLLGPFLLDSNPVCPIC
jgi:hypothetical protein